MAAAHAEGVVSRRILLVFCVNELGGAEAVTLNLVRFREDPEVEYAAVVLAEDGGRVGQELSALRVPWRALRRGRMRDPREVLRAARGVRGAIRELGADVVLANSPQGFLYARLATVGLDVPVAIYYMSSAASTPSRAGKLDVLMTYSRPAAIFTASRRIARELTGWGLRNVQPVYHGTPPATATEAEVGDVRRRLEELGVGPGDPVILLPGRLQPWKGQHVLVAAMPAVLAAHPDAHAVLVGGTLFGQDPGYPDQLREQIREWGLGGRVHLAGHQPSLRGWLQRATVVVHASTDADPFPNVCIEALSVGRPLVTNTISGTAEVVTDGVDAFVVPPADPESLAATLIAALGDAQRRARVGHAGYERYLSTCTPAHMVRPIEREFVRLAGERADARPHVQPATHHS